VTYVRLRGLGDATADALISSGAGLAKTGAEENQYLGSMWDGLLSGKISPEQAAPYAKAIATTYVQQRTKASGEMSGHQYDKAAGVVGTAVGTVMAATPLAPLAPLGALLASKTVSAFAPRPMPAFVEADWIRDYATSMARGCAPGDGKCYADIEALVAPAVNKLGYYKHLDCSVKSSWFGLVHEGPDNPDCDVDPAPGFEASIDAMQPKVVEITALSRLNAELAFLNKAKSAADKMVQTYGARCLTNSCRDQVKGTAYTGAFLVAKESRDGSPGSAAYLLKSYADQLKGIVAEVYEDQAAAYKAELARKAQNEAAIRAALNKGQALSFLGAQAAQAKQRKIVAYAIGGLVGAAAVVATVRIVKKHKRDKR
jgi:hypothetical protein